MAVLETELGRADESLAGLKKDPETKFLVSRVKRLQDLNRQANRLLDNPLVKLFSKWG
jgi:hypothetical protein